MLAKLSDKVCRFFFEENGPTTVEYAILLALLVGMMFSAIIYVGEQAQLVSEDVVNGMDSALNSN